MLQGSLSFQEVAHLASSHWRDLVFAVSIVVSSTLVFIVVYRIWFHPLARFPGPKLSAISQVPQVIHLLNKSYPSHVKALHDRYGTVVRVSPNELTFCSPKAWKDIYGLQPGHPRLTKDPVLYCPDPFAKAYSLISAEGELYQNLRRPFSSAFSQESLLKQEIVIQHHVDLLVKRLRTKIGQQVDMTEWFTWTTFDILGALAFGKSFGSLECEETHFWVAMIIDAVRSGVFLRILGQLPWLKGILMHMIPKDIMEKRKQHVDYSRDALRDSKQDDTTGTLIGHWNSHSKLDVSEDEKVILFSDMIIAGSETTATMLSASVYYLATNPDILEKLRIEFSSHFPQQSEMNARKLAELPYFNAVVEESLRIMPPVPQGLPRCVPPQGREICGHYVSGGTVVSVHSWAITHSNALFPDPEKFDPTRFLGQDKGQSQIEASQPFSTGPRACIGRNLAYIEMRLILANVIREFDFAVCDASRHWTEQNLAGVVWEKGPLNVKLMTAGGHDVKKSTSAGRILESS